MYPGFAHDKLRGVGNCQCHMVMSEARLDVIKQPQQRLGFTDCTDLVLAPEMSRYSIDTLTISKGCIGEDRR